MVSRSLLKQISKILTLFPNRLFSLEPDFVFYPPAVLVSNSNYDARGIEGRWSRSGRELLSPQEAILMDKIKYSYTGGKLVLSNEKIGSASAAKEYRGCLEASKFLDSLFSTQILPSQVSSFYTCFVLSISDMVGWTLNQRCNSTTIIIGPMINFMYHVDWTMQCSDI